MNAARRAKSRIEDEDSAAPDDLQQRYLPDLIARLAGDDAPQLLEAIGQGFFYLGRSRLVAADRNVRM
jgi:hypothetical protein